MSYTEQELSEIVWGDNLLFDVEQENIVSTSRWHTHIQTVLKSTVSQELFILEWRRGATENQDNEFDSQPVPAEAYDVIVTRYRVKSAL